MSFPTNANLFDSDEIVFSPQVTVNLYSVVINTTANLLDDDTVIISDSVFVVVPFVVINTTANLFDEDTVVFSGTGTSSSSYAVIPFVFFGGESVKFEKFDVDFYVNGPPFVDPYDDNVFVIHEERVVRFEGTPREGPYPLTVQFTSDLPSYASVVIWDLGNGTTSTDTNPSALYENPGRYEVTLTARFFNQFDHIGKRKYYIYVYPVSILPDSISEKTQGTIFDPFRKVQKKKRDFRWQ